MTCLLCMRLRLLLLQLPNFMNRGAVSTLAKVYIPHHAYITDMHTTAALTEAALLQRAIHSADQR
jgi:hypothetical protein